MKKIFLMIILMSFFLIGCSSSVYITDQWKANNIESPYESMFITATFDEISIQKLFEDVIENKLEPEVQAYGSFDEMPPRFMAEEMPRDSIMKVINDTESEAILTITLVEKDKNMQSYNTAPAGAYMNFWPYWNWWHPGPFIQQQNFISEETIFVIETNVYDAQSEEIIWTARFEIEDGKNLSNSAQDLSEQIVQSLRENMIIR